ncbi:FAD/NAD(P)-binding domain-containing protein [Coniophora puteana RWD-64-598 SS2]|uniref:FAD/NAD(P)-binding domain-containing protein n=1 Tax=Coniophora puteana (strain RWD-64-598) TaxID=741705 RepID=A0A5M3MQ57_CONPW|nr:FAD/NAD(P)-binding domain-containing protein [Coniophora puteana RWD-64-598 SS2]EIW81187.1 FAD/NAD(P)-binding domain-containing protein [Coniophora puteana RWD-64-598 SS2]
MSNTQPKFRVAICGAGIGGLFLATVIAKFSSNIKIDVYEAHDAVTTAGAGISFRPRTMRIAKELGIYDDVVAVSTFPPERDTPSPIFRVSDIKEGGYEWFGEKARDSAPASMHRMDFVRVIQNHLPKSCNVHLQKRVQSYAEADSGEITIHFADRTTATTDVLVGADGLRSKTRRCMFETAAKVEPPPFDRSQLSKYTDTSYSGYSIYRDLIPMNKLLAHYPDHPVKSAMYILTTIALVLQLCGKGKHLVGYTINGGAMLNFAAVTYDPALEGTDYPGPDTRWVEDRPKQEMLDLFDDYEPMGRAWLDLSATPSRWAIHVVGKLPFWTRGRVAIIGDAAHAATPHLGAGAGAAIEDAWLLGRLLAHPRTALADVPRALAIFEGICKPNAERVADKSMENGKLYDFYTEDPLLQPGEDERSPAALERRREKLVNARQAIVDAEDPLKQWERAEGLLLQA